MPSTYSPEDNKLRLYVGRVPRDEYLALRAEGWTSTPKQDCDFVATWTPARRDTALQYGEGAIDDEDQPMAERSADRAERFSGYRDKRTTEATGQADRYDAGPSAHGYQSQARAERAAARHDRMADRAGDAWSKAEYWQSRTAGVISHALHKSKPGVRMGRIKTLEAELRKHQAQLDQSAALWSDMQKIAAADPEQRTRLAALYTGSRHLWSEYHHPRAADLPEEDYYKSKATSLYSLLTHKTHPITGTEACFLFFSDHSAPVAEDDWTLHYRLRLAYENQMLEAQGGRLEQYEVQAGGRLGSRLILKASKSSVTGRVTSVKVIGPKVGSGYHYQVSNIPGTDWAEYHFDLERVSPESYTPPTPESLAELAEVKATIKAAQKKSAPPPRPLINPTEADAERLQALWNERAKAEHCAAYLKNYSRDYAEDFVPATVTRITQETYSANSEGAYGQAETRGLRAGGWPARRSSNLYSSEGRKYDERTGRDLCALRITSGGGKQYTPPSVIVLTDKPQKPLPAAVWEKAFTLEAVAA